MQDGDAVFYYPRTLDLDEPPECKHIGLVELDESGSMWVRSKLGPDFGIYRHKVDATLPWYGSIYFFRRATPLAHTL